MSTADKQALASAFESFDAVRDAIVGVVRRMVGARDPEYEDLVQSSLLSVIAAMNAGRFRGECSDDGWAAVIARNVAVNTIRARVRERRLFVPDPAGGGGDTTLQVTDPALDPERLTELRRNLDRVQRAMTAVGADKATVVYLHDLLGYSLAEVATLLGTSIAAAQSRLVRGRREIIEKAGRDT